MTELQIVRTKVVVVENRERNDYGDLIFSDKEGNSYKIGTKRADGLDDQIVKGHATELGYAIYKGKEFIAIAKLAKGKLPPPTKADKVLPEHEQVTTSTKTEQTPVKSSPEIGLAYKEIGELYRAGFLDETKPVDKKLIARYKNWIMKTLGIEIEYKE